MRLRHVDRQAVCGDLRRAPCTDALGLWIVAQIAIDYQQPGTQACMQRQLPRQFD
jgi:hypothetical protein